MQAKEYALSFLTQEACVKQAPFSRTFEYANTQARDDFFDLFDTFNACKQAFLGTFILKQTPSISGSMRLLVDGNKRLISMSLLLLALCKNTKENQDEIFFNKEGNAKLLLLGSDKEAFEAVLLGKKVKNCKFYTLYELYLSLLENIKPSKQKEFLHFLLFSKICVLINLSCENEVQVYRLCNETTLSYQSYNLIKSHFFEKAASLEMDLDNLYHDYWEAAFEESKALQDFWKSTQNLRSKQNFDVLLSCFAIKRGFFRVGKNHSVELDKLYKSYLLGLNSKDFTVFLKDFFTFTKLYLSLPRLSVKTHYSYLQSEKRLLLILKECKIDSAMPLLLLIKERLNSILQEKAFYVLECFVVLRQIASCVCKNYPMLFNSLCKKLQNLPTEKILSTLQKELLDSKVKWRLIPSKDQINKSLGRLKPTQTHLARLLLFITELHRRSSMKGMQDSLELSFDFTLEHLLPKEYSKFWTNLAKTQPKSAINKSIQSIGNMTLLRQELNVGLQNKAWLAKLYGDEAAKGIKDCADLKITRELLEDEQWSQKWDLVSIKEREEELCDEMLRIWDVTKAKSF